MGTEKKTCCIFGHRKVAGKEELKVRLSGIFENLIVNENVCTFLFGSRSEFDDLCRDILAAKKEKYPHIQRVYVRGEYPYIDDDYENYLLERCEKTYFPQRAINAGKAVYIERNYEMIDNADICIVYFKNNYLPIRWKNGKRDLFDYQPKSGTGIAYKYAIRKNRFIINVAE
ncbi:MAG: hypothetical protein IJE46_05485 [Clostridia bacterium]|nr:hypothetical protein [Clostridia bacterium]